MTQEMQVLKHITRYGKITSMKAFEKYGITRLAARIHTLRNKGYVINTTTISNGKAGYAAYSMD
jgi:hypothetical protein